MGTASQALELSSAVYALCRETLEERASLDPLLSPLTTSTVAIRNQFDEYDAERQMAAIPYVSRACGVEACFYILQFLRAGIREVDYTGTPRHGATSSVLKALRTTDPKQLPRNYRGMVKSIKADTQLFASGDPEAAACWKTMTQELPSVSFETAEFRICNCSAPSNAQPMLRPKRLHTVIELDPFLMACRDDAVPLLTIGDVVTEYFKEHRTQEACSRCRSAVRTQQLLVGRLPLALCVEMPADGSRKTLSELANNLTFQYRDSHYVLQETTYDYCPAFIVSERDPEHFRAVLMPLMNSRAGYSKDSLWKEDTPTGELRSFRFFDDCRGREIAEQVTCAVLKRKVGRRSEPEDLGQGSAS